MEERPIVPTEEQALIVEKAKSSRRNLMVDALAGAAKTSTLVMIAHAIQGVPILALAFNTRIRDEMVKRLPSHCQAKTLNGVGHGAWQSTISGRLQVDKDKMHNIWNAYMEDVKDYSTRGKLWDRRADIFTALRSAKTQGYIPHDHGEGLISREDFYASLEEEPDDMTITLVERFLQESIHQSYKGLIDFDDQIYMPTIFGGTWPRHPVILGDEVQDWSPLNHAMAELIVRDRRLIAVGDPNQSIYGFRGAMSSGMTYMAQKFNMEKLTLSTSFRCPRAVVSHVKWRVPHMTHPEWAIQGEVKSLPILYVKDVPDGAVFICRNNAPLFSTALNFLRAGRGIKIVGSDLGPSMVKTLKSLGDEHLPQAEALLLLAKWYEDKKKKSRAKATLADRYECLKYFIEQGKTLGESTAYADHLFKASGPIQFTTGHKSKGLEWDTVYHLDPWRVPSEWSHGEQREQELNLKYVIETRAKKSLFLIDGERIVYTNPQRAGGEELPRTAT